MSGIGRVSNRLAEKINNARGHTSVEGVIN